MVTVHCLFSRRMNASCVQNSSNGYFCIASMSPYFHFRTLGSMFAKIIGIFATATSWDAWQQRMPETR